MLFVFQNGMSEFPFSFIYFGGKINKQTHVGLLLQSPVKVKSLGQGPPENQPLLLLPHPHGMDLTPLPSEWRL